MQEISNSLDMVVDQTANLNKANIGCAQFISFAIGDEQYGVDIMAVREIKGWSDITHLPRLVTVRLV